MEHSRQVREIASINNNQYSKRDNWDEIIYLDTGNVTQGRISNLQELNPEVDRVPSRCKRKVKNGSIVYSMVRPNQKHYAILQNPPSNMLVSTGFSVIDANTTIVEPEYLYYVLTSQEATEYCNALAEQSASTYPTLNIDDLAAYSVSVPPLNRQRAIVAIIRAINDKMSINFAINGYLLEICQTLFKYYFADENPVYETKHVDLAAVASIGAGGDKPSIVSHKRTETTPIPIFSNGADDEGLYGFTTEAQIKEESITVSARGTIGLVNWRCEPYFPIVRLISVTPIDERISAKYLYLCLNNLRIQGAGTTQQQLTVPMFKTQKIAIPSTKVMKSFTAEITPLFNTLINCKHECENLSKLRDLLLSKLMSGEIDVSKIDVSQVDATQLNSHLGDHLD